MPWENPSPFGAFASTISGFLTAQQQAKRQAAEDARQAEIDRLNASNIASNIAYRNAEATKAADEDARAGRKEARENAAQGVGLTPPGQLAIPTTGNLTNRQYAMKLAALGAWYLRNGAPDRANTFLSQSKSFSELADKDDAARLAERKQRNDDIRTMGQIRNWDQQHTDRVQKAADDLAIAQGHDATSRANALTHYQATIDAADLNAKSRHDAAAFSSGEAWKRTKYVQGKEDKRQLTGIHYRDKLEQRAARSKATTGKFRTLDIATRAMMVRQMKQAIDNGADPKQVYARAAQLHGIQPEEAEGIYGDFTATGD